MHSAFVEKVFFFLLFAFFFILPCPVLQNTCINQSPTCAKQLMTLMKGADFASKNIATMDRKTRGSQDALLRQRMKLPGEVRGAAFDSDR